MHELAKSEKKEGKMRARSLQARTGPITLSASPSTQEQQQKRIAERAAKAMAQVLRRRREPRSLMMWGDRKKVRRFFFLYSYNLYYLFTLDLCKSI
jgi:hypothetical protein